MATRLIEPLNVQAEDPTVVENWIDRLESSIQIALFTNSDNLPTEAERKEEATNELKRNYLLSCIGPTGYKYLYCSPDNPTTKSFDELVKLIKDHLSPRPKAISEQYKFGLLKQDSGETLSSFMSRVKEAGSTCGFGPMYDQMIRNKFICGLRDSKIRSSLLSHGDDEMTSTQAFENASDKERANQSS